MAAHEGGVEAAFLRGRVCGDGGRGVQWDAVFVNEGIPPPADSRQRCRGVLEKLRNPTEGEPTEQASISSHMEPRGWARDGVLQPVESRNDNATRRSRASTKLRLDSTTVHKTRRIVDSWFLRLF